MPFLGVMPAPAASNVQIDLQQPLSMLMGYLEQQRQHQTELEMGQIAGQAMSQGGNVGQSLISSIAANPKLAQTKLGSTILSQVLGQQLEDPAVKRMRGLQEQSMIGNIALQNQQMKTPEQLALERANTQTMNELNIAGKRADTQAQELANQAKVDQKDPVAYMMKTKGLTEEQAKQALAIQAGIEAKPKAAPQYKPITDPQMKMIGNSLDSDSGPLGGITKVDNPGWFTGDHVEHGELLTRYKNFMKTWGKDRSPGDIEALNGIWDTKMASNPMYRWNPNDQAVVDFREGLVQAGTGAEEKQLPKTVTYTSVQDEIAGGQKRSDELKAILLKDPSKFPDNWRDGLPEPFQQDLANWAQQRGMFAKK